jgi:hypothetical protein
MWHVLGAVKRGFLSAERKRIAVANSPKNSVSSVGDGAWSVKGFALVS